jgi:hypothetical protein
LHVAPRSPAALAFAIRSLTSDDDLRRSLGAGAVRDAASFSWRALVDRLVCLMRRRETDIDSAPLTVH